MFASVYVHLQLFLTGFSRTNRDVAILLWTSASERLGLPWAGASHSHVLCKRSAQARWPLRSAEMLELESAAPLKICSVDTIEFQHGAQRIPFLDSQRSAAAARLARQNDTELHKHVTCISPARCRSSMIFCIAITLANKHQQQYVSPSAPCSSRLEQ